MFRYKKDNIFLSSYNSTKTLSRKFCRLCLMVTTRDIDRAEHRKKCMFRMKCKGCNKSMAQLEKLISRFASHILACGGEDLYKCRMCKYLTTQMADYRKHIINCNVHKRTCVSCQKTYFSVSDLQEHIAKAHPAIKCEICGTKFITKGTPYKACIKQPCVRSQVMGNILLV